MSKDKQTQNGKEPKGLRERVKDGWITAREALEELKSKDSSPNHKIVSWLRRRGAN